MDKIHVYAHRMAAALKNGTMKREKDDITMAIVMNHGILKLTVYWSDIDNMHPAALADFIGKAMRESGLDKSPQTAADKKELH